MKKRCFFFKLLSYCKLVLLKGPGQHLGIPSHEGLVILGGLIYVLLNVHGSFVHQFMLSYKKWNAYSTLCSGELSGSYKFEYTGGEDTWDGSLGPVS